MVLCDIVDDAAATAFDRAVAIDRCSARWFLERTLLLYQCRRNAFFRERKRTRFASFFTQKVTDFTRYCDFYFGANTKHTKLLKRALKNDPVIRPMLLYYNMYIIFIF